MGAVTARHRFTCAVTVKGHWHLLPVRVNTGGGGVNTGTETHGTPRGGLPIKHWLFQARGSYARRHQHLLPKIHVCVHVCVCVFPQLKWSLGFIVVGGKLFQRIKAHLWIHPSIRR